MLRTSLASRHADLTSRSRAVYLATAIGAAAVVLIAAGLYLPLVGFLAATTANTVGLVPFPFASVALVTVAGIAVVALLLWIAFRRRRWVASAILGFFAVLISLAVTAYPLVAVAIGSASRVSDVWPVLTELLRRVTGN